MRRVTKENLITQIDRLCKIKDEQCQLSMNDEYNLQVYEMLLATMDAEPVGEFYEDGPLNWYQISPGDSVPDNRRIPLYCHGKTTPVVPEEMPCGGAADDYHDGYQDGWNACRTAMLNQK